jgi:hypothetical protein
MNSTGRMPASVVCADLDAGGSVEVIIGTAWHKAPNAARLEQADCDQPELEPQPFDVTQDRYGRLLLCGECSPFCSERSWSCLPDRAPRCTSTSIWITIIPSITTVRHRTSTTTPRIRTGTRAWRGWSLATRGSTASRSASHARLCRTRRWLRSSVARRGSLLRSTRRSQRSSLPTCVCTVRRPAARPHLAPRL